MSVLLKAVDVPSDNLATDEPTCVSTLETNLLPVLLKAVDIPVREQDN
ncbi:MAG: hypothetical protein OXC07_06175 [Kistimonas sp.]|nr:hypothetical protein [Kistimonas sp.]